MQAAPSGKEGLMAFAEDEEEQSPREEGGGEAGDLGAVNAQELQDAEGEDEAINDSHYLRGKRFRRLHRLMSSPVVSTAWQTAKVPRARAESLRFSLFSHSCLTQPASLCCQKPEPGHSEE
jgi:hypothetical protein